MYKGCMKGYKFFLWHTIERIMRTWWNPERVTEKSGMKHVVAWTMCPDIMSLVTLDSLQMAYFSMLSMTVDTVLQHSTTHHAAKIFVYHEWIEMHKKSELASLTEREALDRRAILKSV